MGVIETGFYLASINTAGILDPVDTAQFIGGRIRQNNKLTPGRADAFLSEAVPARGNGMWFFEIRILFDRPAWDKCVHTSPESLLTNYIIAECLRSASLSKP